MKIVIHPSWKIRLVVAAVLLAIYALYSYRGLARESCDTYDPTSTLCVGAK